MPSRVTTDAVRSYRTLSPLPARASHILRSGQHVLRRSALCCTFRRLAPPRSYLAPCPLEPGLSSTTRAQAQQSTCLTLGHLGKVCNDARRLARREVRCNSTYQLSYGHACDLIRAPARVTCSPHNQHKLAAPLVRIIGYTGEQLAKRPSHEPTARANRRYGAGTRTEPVCGPIWTSAQTSHSARHHARAETPHK